MKQTEKVVRDEIGLIIPDKGQKNYSVKAGAGGGKTTLLSHRIGNQIIAGTPIEQFVVITYTNAAAAELREKITNRLQELLDSKKLTDEQADNAIAALNSIELMQISTIHAFLLKILRENAFEAGIVMDAKMLETQEDIARKKKFFDDWYHENFDEMEAFRADWRVNSKTGHATDHHREVLENMFYDIASVREKIVFDTSDHTADFEKAAEAYLDTWVPQAVKFITEIEKNAPIVKSAPKLLTAAYNVIGAVRTVENEYNAGNRGCEQAVMLSEALKEAGTTIRTASKYFYGKKYDTEERYIADIYPVQNVSLLDWNFKMLYEDYFLRASKVGEVVQYVCKMQQAFRAEIDNETLFLSNDDILYRAEKLLSKKQDILDQLRERYSKIYVDEFQDTTGQQTKIIKLLATEKGTTLSQNAFTKDKLLVVGDAKQSIYRFTGAEKAVYDEMDALIDHLPNDVAESVNLDSNFRSNAKIVEWVNNSFGALMPGYSPMDADWVVQESQALHGVYRYGDANEISTKAEDVENVVQLVKTLVNNPNYFVERSKRSEDGGFYPPTLHEIQYSDIMILCKNTTNMKEYVNRFMLEGISVNVQARFKIEEDEVLRNFVLLVEYFAGHKNKKKRVTAAQILEGIDVTQIHSDVLAEVSEKLRDMRNLFRKNNLDPAAIIQYLLSHEEFFIPKGQLQKVERVKAYRIRLHQMTEACLSQNTGDLSELVSHMQNYLCSEVKREIPLESNENSIQLMNAHQSKGLTGQIVIIADRSASEECRYGAFRKSGKYYPAASYKISNYGSTGSVIIPSYGYDMGLMNLAKSEELEEAVRLQYVAATRAAHALIIMSRASEKNIPWFMEKAYEYDSLTDIKQWIADRQADTKTYSVQKEGENHSQKTLKIDDLQNNLQKADLEKLATRQIISVTPSGLEPAGVTGFEGKHPDYVKEERPYGNVFGTILHRVFELLFNRYDMINACDKDTREKAIVRVINQAILEQQDEIKRSDNPQMFVDYLKVILQKYYENVIRPIMEEAAEIYPEYTFSFFVPEDEQAQFLENFEHYCLNAKEEIQITAGTIWLNGQADLVVKKKDGTIKVYDYKSDARNGKPLADYEKSLAEKYAGQLALYRYAIGKAFDVYNVETELIHLYRE